MESNKCKDCGQELGAKRAKNHEYCERCIALWYLDNDLDPSEVPNGDFDDDRNDPEY